MSVKSCQHCGEQVSNWVLFCKVCKKFNPTRSKRVFVAPAVVLVMMASLVAGPQNSDQEGVAIASTVEKTAGRSEICYSSGAIGPVFLDEYYADTYVGILRTDQDKVTVQNFEIIITGLCSKISNENLQRWTGIDRFILANKHLAANVSFNDLNSTCAAFEDGSFSMMGEGAWHPITVYSSRQHLEQLWASSEAYESSCFVAELAAKAP